MKYGTPSTLRVMNALFLVAGTCIGGGMLALPVTTAPCGFFPSICIMSVACIAMTVSALYLTEVGFWMRKDDAHIISMSKQFLGKSGKNISWILYLFICYASLIAYTAGCGHMLSSWLDTFCHISLPQSIACLAFICLFGPLLFASHHVLGKLNSLFFIAMCIAFVSLISFVAPHIQMEYLSRSDWRHVWTTTPLLLTAFSFQTMVPSLHPYLQHDPRALRIAIIGGTALAFFVYLIWLLMVQGAVPFEGVHGLQSALLAGKPATYSLGASIASSKIDIFAHMFSFFALITSFLGIALGLYDFLSDGLRIPKKGIGNLKLGMLIIAPTFFFAATYERIFLLALDISGGFGDSILNGMIPIIMLCVGRYYLKKEKSLFHIRGGKPLLASVFLFFFATLIAECILRL